MPGEISYPFNGVFNKGTSDEYFYIKSEAFFNLKWKNYLFEKEMAEQLKIKPALKGTPEFKKILQSGKEIKWAYTIYRELFIVPAVVGYFEVPHSIAASGKPVFTAGFGRWSGEVLELDNWTGHYRASGCSGRLHLEDAWRDTEIRFIVGELLYNSKKKKE
jgi:hypothetical protein